MISPRAHRAAIVALVAALAIGPRPTPAEGALDVGGESGPDGVVITVVEWEGRRAVHVEGGSDACHYTLEAGPPGFAPEPEELPARPPDSHLAVLACDGAAIGLIWVGPHNTVDLAAEADALVRRWVATVPIPRVTIGTNPPRRGLAGFESWMWLRGADRRDRRATLDAFGIPIEVALAAGPVTWDFGDGSTLIAGAGHPNRPAVGHGYTRSSQEAGDAYVIQARYGLEPVYRVAGGEWVALPPIVVEARRRHRVGEAQAIVG